jgi:ADP-ribosylglycohydrolase
VDFDYLTLDTTALRTERRQLHDAGYQVETVADDFEDLLADIAADGPTLHRDRARRLLDRCVDLPGGRPGEPEGEAPVRAARPPGPRRFSTPAVDRDALAGALAGRCAGIRLGKPVETWSRTTIERFLDATDQSPETGYLRADVHESGGFALDATGGWDDRVDGMARDDDLDFTIAAVETLTRAGLDFETADVARTWVDELPARKLHTAERVAYRNLLCGVDPPATARRLNPYRELIGAQIRADVYGYINPGHPERAATLAARDARLSHVRNGVYGARLVAATLAAVPSVSTLREAVEVGLTEIPVRSRLAEAVGDVLGWVDDGLDHVDVVDRIHRRWDDEDDYEGYHVLPNAMVVVAVLVADPALDLPTALGRAVRAGFDTDCNAGTVGSAVGLARGFDALPERWTDPVAGHLRTALAGRHRPTLDGIVADVAALAGNG